MSKGSASAAATGRMSEQSRDAGLRLRFFASSSEALSMKCIRSNNLTPWSRLSKFLSESHPSADRIHGQNSNWVWTSARCNLQKPNWRMLLGDSDDGRFIGI